MSTIIASFFSAVDVPLVAPATAPTIRIRRTDTGALVVVDSAMTERGDGAYSFDFSPVEGLEYSIRADGDPILAGQTIPGGRFSIGSLSGTDEIQRARVLAFAAQENVLLDGGPNATAAATPDYDSAGLMTAGRLRAFDSAANRAAATPGSVVVEAGELFRQHVGAVSTTPGLADSYTSDRAL